MTEPIIRCPNCHTDIKLTESLAAPLIETTRRQFQHQLAQKDADIAKREAAILEQQSALAKAKESIDEQVAAKLKLERTTIAADEARKARLALSNDPDQKSKELAELHDVLKQRDVDTPIHCVTRTGKCARSQQPEQPQALSDADCCNVEKLRASRGGGYK